ncbi:hypothetical protein EDB87DRAFT_1679045 [Lactarius vividus]|nr:hypothetical protein EDB87DRAFT_1679045 [Lactarius vividus]
MSFPPPADNGSAGADLTWYILLSAPRYASHSLIPPHLNGSPEIRFAGAFGSGGRTQTARGRDARALGARFCPFPEPMSAAMLRRAAQTHGATVAAYSARAEASGRPVARGECWDITHEALSLTASLGAPRDAPVFPI